MAWNNEWPVQSTFDPKTFDPSNIPITSMHSPWDGLDQDQLLLLWQEKKEAITKAKNEEMELRKYIVGRAFPDAKEGTNTAELGNGYELKAVVKFNYKLADNDTVENGLDAIAAIGNEGSFIADRLVGWTPAFHLTEYRKLQEEAENGSGEARAILREVIKFLTIEDAAPTLNIKEPKK
jgi:hypothetical protein